MKEHESMVARGGAVVGGMLFDSIEYSASRRLLPSASVVRGVESEFVQAARLPCCRVRQPLREAVGA